MSSVKSVVISCAGIGSRLGLGLTKALVQINGRSLISWQLELFKDVEDIRIVIGFQANDIIEEVRKHRQDVIFIFNHRYFETKTGASFYLGARHANSEILEWDGDLLVHPDDVKMLFATQIKRVMMLSLYVLTNKELYWSSRVRVETMNGLGLHVYVREIWYIVHKMSLICLSHTCQ